MRLKLLAPTATLLTLLSGAQVFASPVIVACGPGQHTVIRNSYLRGEPVTRVACTGDPYRATTARYYERRYGYHRPHRSWGKSALIIGGSAGTGAGIGGVIGGKKGA